MAVGVNVGVGVGVGVGIKGEQFVIDVIEPESTVII